LAIPPRPLPAFLNPEAPAAAPAAAAPATVGQAVPNPTNSQYFRFDSATRKQVPVDMAAVADSEGWQNFQRRAYGLPDKPVAPTPAPTPQTDFVGWLNKLSSALKPAGGQQYDFPLLQQLLGGTIPQNL
jgi:hypothetical protein